MEQALKAAKESYRLEPEWGFYYDNLINVIQLRESLLSLLSLPNIMQDVQSKFIEVYKDLENNLLNYISDKFNKEVEEYLRYHYQYTDTRTKYEPPYLKKEVDVYALKGLKKTDLTVCECKFRFFNTPINEDEITCFISKIKLIKKHELHKADQEGRQLKVRAWFVTNTELVDEEVYDVAKKNKIEIMKAKIPREIYNKVNWQVSDIVHIRKTKSEER